MTPSAEIYAQRLEEREKYVQRKSELVVNRFEAVHWAKNLLNSYLDTYPDLSVVGLISDVEEQKVAVHPLLVPIGVDPQKANAYQLTALAGERYFQRCRALIAVEEDGRKVLRVDWYGDNRPKEYELSGFPKEGFYLCEPGDEPNERLLFRASDVRLFLGMTELVSGRSTNDINRDLGVVGNFIKAVELASTLPEAPVAEEEAGI
jgi:hypothetical protein